MNVKAVVRDFLWVTQAFLRGKFLRQKNYCPQAQGKFFCFSAPNSKCFKGLLKCWGYKPATLGDLFRENGRRSPGFYTLVARPTNEELTDWDAHVLDDVGIRR